jgi:hypothetical protein
MNHAIAEIGSKHFAQLKALYKEADRTAWGIGAIGERFLQLNQLQLLLRFKAQRVDCVALIFAASSVLISLRKTFNSSMRPRDQFPACDRQQECIFQECLITPLPQPAKLAETVSDTKCDFVDHEHE